MSAHQLHLETAATLETVEDILTAMDGFAEQQDWLPKLAFTARLVVEELAMNVASYGSDDPAKPPDIEITVDSEPGALRINIKDTGRPFDPHDAPDPDIHASIEDRRIGGLGHFFVEEMTDEMVYRREDGKNHITLTIYRT